MTPTSTNSKERISANAATETYNTLCETQQKVLKLQTDITDLEETIKALLEAKDYRALSEKQNKLAKLKADLDSQQKFITVSQDYLNRSRREHASCLFESLAEKREELASLTQRKIDLENNIQQQNQQLELQGNTAEDVLKQGREKIFQLQQGLSACILEIESVQRFIEIRESHLKWCQELE